MFSLLTRGIQRPVLTATRHFSLGSSQSPLALLRQKPLTATSNPTAIVSQLQPTTNPVSSIFSNLLSLAGQRRWKSRGNNYQPNTYKRKKTLGFMSRMRSKTGRKIIARRKEKGRWYLSH